MLNLKFLLKRKCLFNVKHVKEKVFSKILKTLKLQYLLIELLEIIKIKCGINKC